MTKNSNSKKLEKVNYVALMRIPGDSELYSRDRLSDEQQRAMSEAVAAKMEGKKCLGIWDYQLQSDQAYEEVLRGE